MRETRGVGGVPVVKGWGNVGAKTIKVTVKVRIVKVVEDWIVLWQVGDAVGCKEDLSF